MRKAFLIVLLLGSLLVLTFAVTGCESTGTITPTATSQFAFLRYTGVLGSVRLSQSANLTAHVTPPHRSTQRTAAVAGVADINPGSIDVYVMDINGALGSEKRVGDQSASINSALLSYDGKKAVFNAETGAEGYYQVYVVSMTDLNNLNPVQITTDANDHYDPQLSQDGNTVLFMTKGDTLPWHVFTVASSGGAVTQVATNYCVHLAAFVPPGTNQIVFSGHGTLGEGVFIMNADGTGVTKLADTYWDAFPAVSPDGKQVAFADGWSGDVYTVGIDGQGLKQLVGPNTADEDFGGDPLFVKDKILYVGAGKDSIEIFAMNADGTGKTALTQNSTHEFFTITGVMY